MNDKPIGLAAGWILKTKKILFKSAWFQLRQDIVLYNNKEAEWTYVEHPGSVFIVPLTSKNEIVLIKIYRYAIDAWCWEIPAGGIGDKAGKSLLEIAKEELEEEAGYTSEDWQLMDWYYTANGCASIQSNFFLARNVEALASNHTEEMETISEVKAFPLTEAVQMVLKGEIRDGETAFGILLAKHHLEK